MSNTINRAEKFWSDSTAQDSEADEKVEQINLEYLRLNRADSYDLAKQTWKSKLRKSDQEKNGELKST